MYEDLTKLLNQLDDGPYGEWIIDKENDGSPEHPLQFPYVHFLNEVVGDLMDTVYHYANNGHDYLFRYDETIQAGGVDIRNIPLKDVDVSSLDGTTVLAMLMMAIREDRFCEGALLEYFENGSIRKWLQRLQEIDNSERT